MESTGKPYRIWIPLLSLFLCLPLGVTRADDLHPPGYAKDGNSLVAYWEAMDDVMGGWESGNTNLIRFNSFAGFPVNQLTEEDSGCGPGVPCLVNSGDQGTYSFWMPNVVDTLPVKLMRVQVTYSGDVPSVDIHGPGFSVVDVGEPVFDIPWNPNATGYFFVDWVLQPNPDWEFVDITFLLDGAGEPLGELHQVVIDSVSTIPIPAAFPLFASALSLLGFAGWKRRKSTAP